MRDRYNVRYGVLNAASVCAVILSSPWWVPHDLPVMHIGPSPQIVFWGMRVDTWSRWWGVMTYSVVSQMSICVNANTLDPFITNVVRDHKTTDKGDPGVLHAIVQLKTAFDWLVSICNTNLWITMQVQFLCVALLADLVITYVMTRTYLIEAGSRTPSHEHSSLITRPRDNAV